LKKSENKTKCKDIYTKYSQSLEKLKNGATDKTVSELENAAEELRKFQTVLSKEESIEFK